MVADLKQKLKVYKGNVLQSETPLLFVPSGLCSVYMDGGGRTPALALSSGPHVYFYRNMRPAYKFTVPARPVHQVEADVWKALSGSRGPEGTSGGTQLRNDVEKAVKILGELMASDGEVVLTERSQTLLNAKSEEDRVKFVEKVRSTPLIALTNINTMAVLKKSHDEATAVGCLVLGTEDGRIVILDGSGTTVVKSIDVGEPIGSMSMTGLLDVEYRIVASGRSKTIHSIRNGELTGVKIELDAAAVGLVRIDKYIVVGTMDRTVSCYHVRGKRMWTFKTPANITNVQLLHAPQRSFRGCLVALANGQVRMYNETSLIGTVTADDVVTALEFGPFAREQNALVLITRSGALSVKMLPRSVTLDTNTDEGGPPPEQDIPIPVPPKTRVAVDNANRERGVAADMHAAFQRDLFKLRLSTARMFASSLHAGGGPVSTSTAASVRLTVAVQGLGPRFRVLFGVTNTGDRPERDLPLSWVVDGSRYVLKEAPTKIPLALPGLVVNMCADIEVVSGVEDEGVIRLMIGAPGNDGNSTSYGPQAPIVTAEIFIPTPQPLFIN